MFTLATSPLLPLFGRLLWLLLGPLALVVTLLAIIQGGNGWLTPPDLTFFAVLAAMMLGRWLEFRAVQATRSGAEITSASELANYLFRLSVGGLTVWAAANLVGNYWLVS